MSTLLGRIIESKREELEGVKRAAPESLLEDAVSELGPTRGFARALVSGAAPRVIAELKKASPTKGVLRPDFDVEHVARCYAAAGAAAMSVLTESRFFQGDLSYVAIARAVSHLPALRKDFIFDEYQVLETRASCADAMLLIVAALDPKQLSDLLDLAHSLTLDVLVEVHDEHELEIAAALPCDVIGVNNRNLKTGEVDLAASVRIAPLIPDRYCKISESGIKTYSDMQRLLEAGYRGFLIGESLVVQPDPGVALLQFLRPA